MKKRAIDSCVAIIPARGGSKGLPRKNLRFLAGKPLVAHSVDQAIAAACLQRVVVSTDDDEIAQVARARGAEAIERPTSLSDDIAPSESALIHSLHHMRENMNYEPDVTVFLQCTSPLTLAADIDAAINHLIETGADSLVSVTPFHHFLWREDENGHAAGINHNRAVRLRRQDLEPQYLENGAIYVMRTAGFLKARHRFFGELTMYAMPPERSIEIDTAQDLEQAEILLRSRQRSQAQCLLPAHVGAVIFDFDGVLTDNRVLVFQTGEEAVICDRGDGLAFEKLKSADIPILVLSKERNSVAAARCAKLGIDCLQGIDNKLQAMRSWLHERGIALETTIYFGNDSNDVECMRAVGCAICPNDAHPSAKSAAAIVLERSGGRGAVRELNDLICNSDLGF